MTVHLPNIENIRQMIDEKDQQMRHLLIERAELVIQIGLAKKSVTPTQEGTPHIALRPAREAIILRRLLAQDSGHLPKSVLVAIWREMIASFCNLQFDFSVAYWGENEPDAARDMVRYYFGHTVSIKRCQTVRTVLQSVSDNKTTIGIVPAPDTTHGSDGNWWLNLSQDVHVSGILPFVKSDPATTVKNGYYFISKAPAEESGNDSFMLFVDTVPDVSRMTIVLFLKEIGYEARTLAIYDDLGSVHRHHLIEVVGYVSTEQEKSFSTRLSEIAEGKIYTSRIIGRYPSPLDIAPIETKSPEEASVLVAPF